MVDILEPQWKRLSTGDFIDVVAYVILKDGPHGHRMQAAASGTTLHFCGTLPPGSFLFTLLQVRVTATGDIIKCCMDDKSRVWPHMPWTPEALSHSTETCIGMGGFTEGLENANVTLKVGNDIQRPYAQWMTAK